MPIFPSTSKAVYLEIRALFETPKLGRDELVGRIKTTLEELLVHDGPFGESSPFSTLSCPLTVVQKFVYPVLMLSARHFCSEQSENCGSLVTLRPVSSR
jgi:hypothetical protein